MDAAQQENMREAARLGRQAVLWGILAFVLFALAVGYPLGLFQLL